MPKRRYPLTSHYGVRTVLILPSRQPRWWWRIRLYRRIWLWQYLRRGKWVQVGAYTEDSHA